MHDKNLPNNSHGRRIIFIISCLVGSALALILRSYDLGSWWILWTMASSHTWCVGLLSSPEMVFNKGPFKGWRIGGWMDWGKFFLVHVLFFRLAFCRKNLQESNGWVWLKWWWKYQSPFSMEMTKVKSELYNFFGVGGFDLTFSRIFGEIWLASWDGKHGRCFSSPSTAWSTYPFIPSENRLLTNLYYHVKWAVAKRKGNSLSMDCKNLCHK